MKLNTLLVAAVLASTSLSSCVFKTADENQLKYTHTTLVDGDAYAFFRQVGSIAPYEVSYAEHVATVGNAQAKDAAAKAAKFFSDILPQMDSLATKYHVDFPILGTEKFTGEGQENIAVEPNEAPVVVNDSTIADSAAPLALQHAKVYSDQEYLSHIQHQVALVKEQFRRLSRNTNKDLRDFAQSQTETVAQLFTAVGGKADAHAHH
ncbi:MULTISPECIES: hypothetical protein [Sphingobacterium]|uniref:hypothetical protein n=1 Tax=Sphingobacterium TaxID=28453 RepID=UPI001625D4A8|nr:MULTISPECIES: hypothetical protein [Sphingobacterium]MBV2226858.1 hypothetical protein [Sphingobacterium mizutaii]